MNQIPDIIEQGQAHAAFTDDRASTPVANPSYESIEPHKNLSAHKDDDSKIDAPLAVTDKKTFKEAWNNLHDAVGDLFHTGRHNTITNFPRPIVNNSSNILGAAHVGTEVLMFKASLKGAALVEHHTGPIDWVQKAFTRVFRDSFIGAGADVADMKKAIKAKPLTGFFHYIFDMDAATSREVKAQVGMLDTKKNVLIERSTIKLGNPWQTRSTLSGLIVWSLSAMIPDRKESPDDVERMTILRDTNLPRYVGERLKEAVWVPEWPNHKRQMIGLGIMVSGVCSTLGSWRNYVKTGAGPTYKFNLAYFATSLLTFASSLPLLFATDDQKGFGAFGSWMAGRLLFLPSSIAKKISGGEDGAMHYLGASVAFQAENLAQAMIGGAEKRPDGTIVDHTEIKRKAHEEAKKIKKERGGRHVFGSESFDQPSTMVTKVESAEKAMPELAAAHAEQMKS